jgi:hypothetical protein
MASYVARYSPAIRSHKGASQTTIFSLSSVEVETAVLNRDVVDSASKKDSNFEQDRLAVSA